MKPGVETLVQCVSVGQEAWGEEKFGRVVAMASLLVSAGIKSWYEGDQESLGAKAILDQLVEVLESVGSGDNVGLEWLQLQSPGDQVEEESRLVEWLEKIKAPEGYKFVAQVVEATGMGLMSWAYEQGREARREAVGAYRLVNRLVMALAWRETGYGAGGTAKSLAHYYRLGEDMQRLVIPGAVPPEVAAKLKRKV